MTVQRLQPTHAPAYRTLMLAAYAAHPEAFTSTPQERASLPLDWWAARLATDAAATSLVFGAFGDDDRLLGVAGLAFETRQRTAHKADLFGMYLVPAARGQGFGRALVDAALAAARQRPGVILVQLTVTQGNTAALRLYRQCGFVPFGIEPNAITGPEGYLAKVHMWCDLRAATGRTAP